MKNQISQVKPGSIAEEMGVESGDVLLSINGNKVNDIIDYKFLMTDNYVEVDIKKPNGEIWNLEIEKEYDEDLGVEFKEFMLDKPKSCHNKCIFCFIDQLPSGMRDTLYFKDDDSRLAFLQGNFVTLTNMTEDDINRIIKYKISPINVSVHTTDPDLRIKMLNNRFAGKLYEILKKLASNGIEMNCQIVLCPGINDNEHVTNTIEDLFKLYPQVRSVAVVPLGITKFRKGLFNLKLYNEKTAREQLDRVDILQKKYMSHVGDPFVRMSDEFYIIANRDVPDSKFYGKFNQIEDGIGMIRLFRDNIDKSLVKFQNEISKLKGEFTFITGTAALNEIKVAADRIMRLNGNIDIEVKGIVNNFFGDTITVAGLVTAQDIIEQLKDCKVKQNVVIPECMLRKGYEIGFDNRRVFLDDMTVEMLEKKLNRNISICKYTGEDLLDIIIKKSSL
jgi:putative radical SAM enzyme (TIGR03279 family)